MDEAASWHPREPDDRGIVYLLTDTANTDQPLLSPCFPFSDFNTEKVWKVSDLKDLVGSAGFEPATSCV
jgi:hypothetical protein